MLRQRVTSFGAIIFLAPPLFAATVTVRQDGSGDFTTVSAAVAAAAANDVIDVGPGTYAESIATTKSLTLFSSAGRDQTVFDGQSSFQVFIITDGAVCSFDGFTFIRGSTTGSGGAIHVTRNASVTLEDCLFRDNFAGFDGASFIVARSSTIRASNCVFRDNFATNSCPGGVAIQNSLLSYDDCVFVNNATTYRSGAIGAGDSHLEVRRCLFAGNSSGGTIGAIHTTRATGTIDGNTLYSNSAHHENVPASMARLDDSPGLTVRNNIFSSSPVGYGLLFVGPPASHDCNVFWANDAGPSFGDALQPGEVVADPLFCSPLTGDFTIALHSPAAPEHSACGLLVGAFPAVCATVAVESQTWSRIKGSYRR